MKKLILFACAFALTTLVFAQTAKKYALVEHYTSSTCPPCATSNPVFKANVLDKYEGSVHHVEYHVPIPVAGDPMYAYNEPEIDIRMTYYGINSAPSGILQGNVINGHILDVTADEVQKILDQTSDISVSVTETDNDTSRDVTVSVKTVGNKPSGSYVLFLAVIEKEIDYTGSTGESEHHNVFRDMVSNINGDSYTPAEQGSSIDFSYSYNIDSLTWDSDEIYTIAWVQNTSTLEIVNSGSSRDPKVSISTSGSNFVIGNTTSNRSFTGNISSLSSTSSESVKVKITADAPTDWNATFEIAGTSYTDSATISIAADDSVVYTITVEPGATAAVGSYTITISSATDPNTTSLNESMYVISGVTDLIVNNDGSSGNGDDTSSWAQYYDDGLSYAGNTSYDQVSTTTLLNAFDNDALRWVRKIYFNVGWTFPSLTDNLVAHLTNHFTNNGGRLFISGQDIGWETNESTSYGTAATKQFYADYSQATYIKDSYAATSIGSNSSDGIFGALSSSTLLDDVYGTDNSGNKLYYPDELAPTSDSKAILYYNSNNTNVAGVRTIKRDATNNWKTVYLGIGLEQISDESVRKEILKLTHDWFSDVTSVEEFDSKMQNLSIMGQNFPNPVIGSTEIELSNVKGDHMKFQVLDVLGKIVHEELISSNTQKISVDTKNLNAGVYLYRLVDDGGKVVQTNRMNVVR